MAGGTVPHSLAIMLFHIITHSFWAVATSICILTIVAIATLVVYRLYFHPLSPFPGPRLAAATSWYECYYEVFKDGSYVQQLPRLHAQYGMLLIHPP